MKTKIILWVLYLCIALGYIFFRNIGNSESTWIISEFSVTCFILSLALGLQAKTIYLDKKKQVEIRVEEVKAINTGEQNALLQKLANERLQSPDAETRNIPIEQRWNRMKKEIDRMNDHFTIRLKIRFPKLSEDEIRLCCLIRIGMDTQWIIQHLNINKEYFRTKKSRLAKALQVQNCKKQLEQFILEF